MQRTRSQVWKSHGLVDFKFKDLNLDSFTDETRRWQWHLFRIAYRFQICIWIALDIWTVAGLAHEPNIPKVLVVIQGISSFAGILIMIAYQQRARLLFNEGDLSDTFSDSNARLFAASQDFRILCLFVLIYQNLGKNVKRLMSLRAEVLDWRTLIFTQTPQLYVLLGYAKLVQYSQVIVFIKIALLGIRVLKLCIILAMYPFVRCAIMARTRSLSTGVFEYCSLETEKIINDIVKGKTLNQNATGNPESITTSP